MAAGTDSSIVGIMVMAMGMVDMDMVVDIRGHTSTTVHNLWIFCRQRA